MREGYISLFGRKPDRRLADMTEKTIRAKPKDHGYNGYVPDSGLTGSLQLFGYNILHAYAPAVGIQPPYSFPRMVSVVLSNHHERNQPYLHLFDLPPISWKGEIKECGRGCMHLNDAVGRDRAIDRFL